MPARAPSLTTLGSARLLHQAIARCTLATPADVVRSLVALQAQDFPGAKWSVALRVAGGTATDAAIERAIADRAIVRTWPMRGTLHFVAPEDVRWLLALLTPRVLAGAARRHRELELDTKTFSRAARLFEKHLHGRAPLTRSEIMTLLGRAKIATAHQRGYHLLWWAAQNGLICFGPVQGKEQTFVWLDDWIPPAKLPSRNAALATLAQRYFTSHGPATLADFAWWSGLKITDARAGLEAAATHLAPEKIGDTIYWQCADSRASTAAARELATSVFLLPGFDEFLLGYTDRSAVLDPAHAQKIQPFANGQFSSTLLVGGRVAGTWKRTPGPRSVEIVVQPFAPLSRAALRSLRDAAERYGRFLGLPAVLRCTA